MFNLIKKEGWLPATVDELVPMSFIGQAAVNFFQTKLKVMTQLKMTDEQRKVTLRDAQEAAEMLLDIEARIGELLPTPLEARAFGQTKDGSPMKAGRRILPEGVDHKKSYEARTIKNHPGIVDRIKAQAREREDLATKMAVLNAVSYERKKARQTLQGKAGG